MIVRWLEPAYENIEERTLTLRTSLANNLDSFGLDDPCY